MKKTIMRFLSLVLCATMLFGTFQVPAMAAVDDPIAGETGSGWSEVGVMPGEQEDHSPPVSDSGTGEIVSPGESEEEQSSSSGPAEVPSGGVEGEQTPPTDESSSSTGDTQAEQPGEIPEDDLTLGTSGLKDSWLQEYQKEALTWPSLNQRARAARVANVPETTPLTWSGDHITFANGAYIGSPIPKIYFNGEVAFCGEWNGLSPSGSYHEITSGNDSTIKQYLANFDKSSKGKGEYIATQVLIWCRVMGTSVTSWGGSPGADAADEIRNGGNSYSGLRYQYKEFGGGTQNIITYNTDVEPPEPPEPPEYPEDKYHIEVTTDVVTETEVRNRKTYEYSDAIGQITIRKHDQDGKSLDGALFNIVVEFSDGTDVRVNNWEVDNGARLFTWTHPRDNHDPATVTVTEVVPPRYYEGDPTPKTAVVHPTYTRVTHVETWTVTITTENTSSTVIEIESGDVVAESTSSSSAEVSSDPQVEEFADFIEGDRETTVTFVNRRITGDIEVVKKDANTGAPLAGATIHLWGDDLGEPQHIDRLEVTGTDGVAYFQDLPPGTYVIQETQPPHGYHLNDEKQTVALQSAQVIRKEVRNYRKDGLTIKKVDPDGKPIAGAVFELRRGSGEVLLSETTDENGTIFRDYLSEGLYVIEEKKAPEGYLLDENPIKELYIYATDDNKQYTITFVNKKKPAIEVTKIDAETPTLKLPGAVFRITDTMTNNYWDIKTGEDGTALLEGLEIGTTYYIVEELEPPEGYLNSGYRQEIVLKESRVHTLTVADSKMPALEIVKKDKVTGAFLKGATFRVSWNNGADYRDVTTGRDGKATLTGLKDGWYTILETNAPEGYLLDTDAHQILLEAGKSGVIELFNEAKPSLTILKLDSVTKTPLQYAKFRIEQKTEAGLKLVGEYATDADGMVRLENIAPGRYLITEIVAPDGYNIDTATHEVTIEFGQAYKVELTNTPKSPIYIQKVDENGEPLAGAKFRVSTMNGAMVGTVTSGRTGYAIIPYAEPGWYVVEEVQAPNGYVLSSTPINVEVKSGRPAQVEFVNYQKPMLQILKLDTGTGKALLGAKFRVTQADGALVGEYTTGKDGLITIEGLAPGAYIITEIRSPDGYTLDMTPQTITLESGKTRQVEFYNTAKPGLQLLKLDKVTGQPIQGTMFSVMQLLNGAKKDLGTFTTGENGTFYIPDLAPGDYIITEIKAAEGYIPDSTPQNIHVEGGKLNTVEVYNIPYGSLRLVKLDSETRAPLEGAAFKLFDEKRLEVGTYTTSAQGEIYVRELPAGNYFIQEVKSPAGYLLDNTVRAIELLPGKTTTVEIPNEPLGSLRIVKVDAETGKPLYGAVFLLYDAKDNLLGEYTTDQNGSIPFNSNLKDGRYKIKEIKAPDGYVLDQTVHTVTVKEGTTTELRVENEPIRGKIQIIKKSADYNDVTKLKKGALLKDAVFEIFDKSNAVVDRITTDSRGVATSKDLPVGVYGVREITAPKHYILDDEPFYAEIKVAGDLVKFEVLNYSEELGVDVRKYGNYEAMPGDIIRYDFEKISNTSTVPLDDFYWHDVLPTDAVRLQKIVTGTWNERLTYEVEYKTNKRGWRTRGDGLSSKTSHTLDCSRSALKLKSGEYITEFRFQFGTVQEGFAQEDAPYILCGVNGDLPNEYRFTNKTDVGGQREDEWVTAKDAWVTIIYAKPRGQLPQTGF